MDPMNVDALPTDPPADAGDEGDSVEDHPVQARFQVKFQAEAPLARRGDAEQEQSDPSSGDPSISEDDEEAPLTGNGALQEE